MFDGTDGTNGIDGLGSLGGVTDTTTCLPEDLLLLCARQGDRRIRQPVYFPHALAGAILAELLFTGALRLDGKRLHAYGNPPLRHPALAAAATSLLPNVTGREAHASPPA